MSINIKETLRGELSSQTILHATRIPKTLTDIPRRGIVVHRADFFARIRRHEISEQAAASHIARAVDGALKRGDPVFIYNGATAESFAIQLFYTNGGRVVIKKVNHFGNHEASVKFVENPSFTARFEQGAKREEFHLSIIGSVYGAKDNRLKVQQHISSVGPYIPGAFTIGTDSQLFLARVDSRDSLTCSWEYLGGAKWVASMGPRRK